jgi:phthalate 4,5-dioxygenase
VQRRNEGPDGYTGIPGVREQDRAITSSMGPIYDRTQEHLGTSDTGIIRARRRLIGAAKAFAETGAIPPGVLNPEFYRVRSGETLLPVGANWVEETKEYRKAFVEHPDLDWSLAEAR